MESQRNLENYIAGLNRQLEKFIAYKYPTQYLSELIRFLKEINTNPSEEGQAFLECLEESIPLNEIETMREKIETLIKSFLTKKLRPELQTKQAKQIEEILTRVFQMRIFSPFSMNKIHDLYKEGHNGIMTPEFSEKLAALIEEAVIEASNPKQKSEPRKKLVSNVNNKDVALPANMSDCMKCLKKTKEMIFVPCHHFLMCNGCSSTEIQCPICRTKIESQFKVFWA